MCVELYLWSTELEGIFVSSLAPRWVWHSYLSKKVTNNPLYLWVISLIWGFPRIAMEGDSGARWGQTDWLSSQINMQVYSRDKYTGIRRTCTRQSVWCTNLQNTCFWSLNLRERANTITFCIYGCICSMRGMPTWPRPAVNHFRMIDLHKCPRLFYLRIKTLK